MIAYTPIEKLRVKEHTVLTCTPDSYFQQIYYKGEYDLNGTCFALTQQREINFSDLYTGIRRCGSHKPLELNGKTWTGTVSYNNGLHLIDILAN